MTFVYGWKEIALVALAIAIVTTVAHVRYFRGGS